MWDKENNSDYIGYVNSYLKYDVEAELMRMVSTGLWNGQVNVSDTLVMPETKENRRKYLLIRR